jgi:long-chain fatty acid transport protein
MAPGFAAGARERSESQLTAPPHFYWVEPLGERWTFGLGVNSPFGLTSEWAASDFSGRFLSRRASLVSLDISPNVAWKATETLGVGFGLIARFSEIELVRNLPSFDPAAGAVVDIAEFSLVSDVDSGIGYQAGISSHPNPSWSWGLSYRSKVEIDYGGAGRLRQIPTTNPALDAFLAATLPFGQDLPLVTTIEFPDMASLGFAVKPSREWLVELDFNWTGWSSLKEYRILFPRNSEFDVALPQNWKDVYNYRLGASRTGSRGNQWRFGVSLDQTPQPLSTLDPILPDGDQSAVTVGYGFDAPAVTVDLAVMYLDVEERTTRSNINGFNGTYTSSAVVFASTVTW